MNVARLLHKWLNKGIAVFGVIFWYSGTLANAPMLYALSASVLAFKVSGTIYATLSALGLAVDNIPEYTAGNGVLIDGVRMRDGATQLTVGASTAAAGSTISDATALPAGTGGVYPTTGADDTKGVKLTATDQVTGRVIFVGNNVSNKILKVYGPSGAVINGAAADAAFSSVSGKGVVMVCLSGAGNTWLGF